MKKISLKEKLCCAWVFILVNPKYNFRGTKSTNINSKQKWFYGFKHHSQCSCICFISSHVVYVWLKRLSGFSIYQHFRRLRTYHSRAALSNTLFTSHKWLLTIWNADSLNVKYKMNFKVLEWKKDCTSPGQCGSVDWVTAYELKGY